MTNRRHAVGTAWRGHDGTTWEHSPNGHNIQIRWSRAEDDYIHENYPTMSTREMADYMCRDRKTIVRRAKTLGIQKDMTAINKKRSENLKKFRPLMRQQHTNNRALENYIKNETEEMKAARIEKMKATRAQFTDVQKLMIVHKQKKSYSKEKKEEMKRKVSEKAKERYRKKLLEQEKQNK